MTATLPSALPLFSNDPQDSVLQDDAQQDSAPQNLSEQPAAAAIPSLSEPSTAAVVQPPPSSPTLTPMLAQYWQLKQQHPDCLLLFRLGDFYELFFDDAVQAAPVLGVVLTRRGKGGDGADIPMCGIPWHQLEAYAGKLLRCGWYVAICEQVATPVANPLTNPLATPLATPLEPAPKTGKTAKPGKALMNRQVVRIMTPGTLTEEPLLNPRSSSWLASLAEVNGQYALAWAELSTGSFHTQLAAAADLDALLHELQPRELLLADGTPASLIDPSLLGWPIACKRLPVARFNATNASNLLCQHYNVATLAGFAELTGAEVTAAGVLLDYLKLTQLAALPHLRPPQPRTSDRLLAIDAATRRGLELTQTTEGEREGSLLAVMDACLTATGSRLLAKRLNAPLAEGGEIEARLDEVASLLKDSSLRGEIRQTLKQCPDLLRPLSRLCLGRGGPRDLGALAAALTCANHLRSLLQSTIHEQGLVALSTMTEKLGDHHQLADQLLRALADELPVQTRDGQFIRPGYSELLDEQRRLSRDSAGMLSALEARFRQQTGVQGLRIKAHQQFGHVIEVAASQGDRLVQAGFVHRQTLSNLVRFHHPELQELSQRLLAAEVVALATEQRLFDQLLQVVQGALAELTLTAEALAELDVTAGLAEVALVNRWCRPEFAAQSVLEVTAGQHPVVAHAMHQQGGTGFVANDCWLTPGQRLWLMTGPNMAGKSTFLRQNALIVVMAQMGSFVPAARCRLGLVDRLFARIGASDDLAKGRSTFMVEMVETARILHQASEKSLLIMDEIGRGTATHDGLALAQAVVEHLHHHNRCRGLFATHYHELTALAGSLPDLACYHLAVKEWQDSVVFLHQVAAGAAHRSYGLHVAQLAGLPATALSRAGQLLAALEAAPGQYRTQAVEQAVPHPITPNQTAHDQATTGDAAPASGAPTAALAADPAIHRESDVVSLYEAPPPADHPLPPPLQTLLTQLQPDDLSPKQALEFCYDLHQLVKTSLP